jgi:hypothetical protein
VVLLHSGGRASLTCWPLLLPFDDEEESDRMLFAESKGLQNIMTSTDKKHV